LITPTELLSSVIYTEEQVGLQAIPKPKELRLS